MLTGIQMRRPDLAYFSGSQIDNSLHEEEPIPEFLIEIISPTDDAIKIEEKLAEYFKSSVKVVWHIYPENKDVYVYTSRKQVKICTDTDVCSAAPVLSDFDIPVNDLFALPAWVLNGVGEVKFVGVREVNFPKVDFSEAITNSKYQQHTRFIL